MKVYADLKKDWGAFGFGREMPLLYRSVEDHGSLLVYRPEIAQRVNARLEEAYSRARALIQQHRSAVKELARTLVAHDTLEGQELTEVLDSACARRAALRASCRAVPASWFDLPAPRIKSK